MLQVDHEDKQNAALNAFNELWKSKFAEDSLLVFSTGRSLALYNELRVCSKFPSACSAMSSQRGPCTAAARNAQHISCIEGALGISNMQLPHRQCCLPAAEDIPTCRKRCPLACQTCWCAQLAQRSSLKTLGTAARTQSQTRNGSESLITAGIVQQSRRLQPASVSSSPR